MSPSDKQSKGKNMPANIETFADGTAAFFSNREIPWHNLGVITDGAQTAEDALHLAHLDWRVTKSEEPVQVPVVVNDGVQMVSLADKFMTYRDHPKLGMQGLGVVGNQYQVIQNSEAFDFLNHLVDESGAVFETAGSLRGGRQVFMSLKMPNSIVLAGGQDTVDLYLMATTSHDGSTAFTVAVTPIRPVCTNTVRLALKEAQSTWYVRHTTHVGGKIAQARETLGIAFDYNEAYQKAVDDLVSQPFSDVEFKSFLESLVKEPKIKSALKENRVEAVRAEMFGLWNAPTQQNVANTKWAAYNAVVEYADWFKPVRSKNGDKDVVRAERIFTGGVDSIKDRAYAMLAR